MSARKPELQNIDAETQIFTPAYVAKYLAQNSIGRIWLASKPTSKVKDEFGWYVDSPQPDGIATVSSPEEIRVIDPACGTGNLLVAAFDVLYEIYRSERYKPAEIPALILRNNLVGRDIDRKRPLRPARSSPRKRTRKTTISSAMGSSRTCGRSLHRTTRRRACSARSFATWTRMSTTWSWRTRRTWEASISPSR